MKIKTWKSIRKEKREWQRKNSVFSGPITILIPSLHSFSKMSLICTDWGLCKTHFLDARSVQNTSKEFLSILHNNEKQMPLFLAGCLFSNYQKEIYFLFCCSAAKTALMLSATCTSFLKTVCLQKTTEGFI